METFVHVNQCMTIKNNKLLCMWNQEKKEVSYMVESVTRVENLDMSAFDLDSYFSQGLESNQFPHL